MVIIKLYDNPFVFIIIKNRKALNVVRLTILLALLETNNVMDRSKLGFMVIAIVYFPHDMK